MHQAQRGELINKKRLSPARKKYARSTRVRFSGFTQLRLGLLRRHLWRVGVPTETSGRLRHSEGISPFLPMARDWYL